MTPSMFRAVCVMSVLLIANMFASCIHDYPTEFEGEVGIDPTMVTVEFEVIQDRTSQQIARINKYASCATAPAVAQRYVLELRRNGDVCHRWHTLMPLDSISKMERVKLPLHLPLHAVEYEVAFWSDYVTVDDNRAFYDTESLERVITTMPYVGNSELKLFRFANLTIDLRGYRDQWNACHAVQIHPVSNVGKYRLIATDVEKFKSGIGGKSLNIDSLQVSILYSESVASAFNVYTGLPCAQSDGVAYSTAVDISNAEGGELDLAFDYMFANPGNNYLYINMEVSDAAGRRICSYDDISLIYYQGLTTTLRGDFLTRQSSGGIDVVTEWNGEIIIEI